MGARLRAVPFLMLVLAAGVPTRPDPGLPRGILFGAWGVVPEGAGWDAATGLPCEVVDRTTGIALVLARPDGRPLYVGRYEVTWDQWERGTGGEHRKKWWSNATAPDAPAQFVSRDEAHRFATDLGFRLPTETEWQALRAAGGDDPLAAAWYAGNAERPRPVGSKPPDRLGLYDLLGNVCEWCADSDAHGCAVARGGSWRSEDPALLPTEREDEVDPHVHDGQFGLRVVRDP